MTAAPGLAGRTLGVLGDLLEDVVVWLDEPLRHATDSAGTVHRTRGGSAANVAACAAPLVPTRFLGCVGDDHLGDGLVAALAATGVDVRVQRAGASGTVVVLVEPDGERTMIPARGAAALLQPVADEWLTGLALLHVPSYAFPVEPVASTAVDALTRVRAAGGLTSLDVSSAGTLDAWGRERYLALLDTLAPDVLFANADEARWLGAWQPTPRTLVVVKQGADPTLLVRDGVPTVEVPLPGPVEVRDATGAGDAFAAGFLAALLDGSDPAACALAGHRLAARILTSPGATLA